MKGLLVMVGLGGRCEKWEIMGGCLVIEEIHDRSSLSIMIQFDMCKAEGRMGTSSGRASDAGPDPQKSS